MKPQYAKEAVAGPENKPAKGGLDRTITRWVRSTAGWIKRWYKAILVGLGIVVVVAAVNALLSTLSESRLESLNDRISRFLSAGRQSNGAFDAGELEALRAELEGHALEGPFAAGVVSLLLERADSANAPDDPFADPGTTAPKISADDAAAARQKAAQIAAETAERHPTDAQLQTWAQGIRKRVADAADANWMPKPWTFGKLPVPGDSPPASGGAPEAPRAPEAPQTPGASAGAAAPTETPGSAAPAGDASGAPAAPQDEKAE